MSMLALPGILQQQGGGGGGGTTVYIEQDFTTDTSGDLSTVGPDIDELGGGWVTSSGGLTDWDFQASNTGVMDVKTTSSNDAVIQTDGREDVQVSATIVLARGSADARWQGIIIRSSSDSSGDALVVRPDGSSTDPDLVLVDVGVGTLKTWDLSVLMTTPPDSGDTIDLVVRCSGNDVTFYSMAVNGGSAEVIDDTYALTGGAATAHGSGSGADYYGLFTNERANSSGERYEYFKVESIP